MAPRRDCDCDCIANSNTEASYATLMVTASVKGLLQEGVIMHHLQSSTIESIPQIIWKGTAVVISPGYLPGFSIHLTNSGSVEERAA